MSANHSMMDRIAHFVYPPAEEGEDAARRLQRAILVVMASATSLGGIVWGIFYLILGVPEVSVWPFGYVVLSFINLVYYLQTKHYRVLQIGQLSLIMFVPTFLQWHLGGFSESGAVMIWAFLSPIVALTVSDRPAGATKWFVAFVILVVTSGILEPVLVNNPAGMPVVGRNIFFVMNTFAPLTVTYYIVFYFMGQTQKAEAHLRQQSQELAEANQSLTGLTAHLEQTTRDLRGVLGRMTAVLNSLVDGLVVTDMDGIITDFNSTLVQMLGLKDSEIRNKPISSLFNQDLIVAIENVQQSPTNLLSAEIALPDDRIGGAKSSPIIVSRNIDGHVQSSGITDSAEIIGTVTLIRDITIEKEVDRMKTDFISTVSHELRTPLTSVLGFAKIIQKRLATVLLPEIENHEDKKVQRAIKQVTSNVDIIVSEGERLTELINDVLDIAKMEAGKVDWNIQPISLAKVVERSINATSALFDENHPVKFVAEIDENVPLVPGDEDRLIQVVINLISNASKFTEEGTVSCRVWSEDEKVLVSVTDTGIGIPKDSLGTVFEKFTQVGNTLTDKPHGTGLGLPICQQIINSHGGQIWVDSVVGEGTSFIFSIPEYLENDFEQSNRVMLDRLLHDLKNKVHHPLTALERTKKQILIVDDEEHIRTLLRDVLETEDYAVREAKDGVEAIAEIKREIPDLIILDIMMPNVNGFDLAAILKNDPQFKRIPIIILSIVEDKQRGYQLGINHYLHKPVDEMVLVTEIERIFQTESGQRKVLVMDEDAETLKTLVDAITEKGHEVIEAKSNQEMLAKAKDNRPDIIVVASLSEEQKSIIQSLRSEEGLEDIYLMIYE